MNLQINRDDYHHICVVCINEKMNVESFRKSKNSEIKIWGVLELVHSDALGPIQNKHTGVRVCCHVYRQLVTIYCGIFPRIESEVLEKFVEYKALLENQKKQMNQVYLNRNGVKYIKKNFTCLWVHVEVLHRTNVSYSPQVNILAVRMNTKLI